MKTRLVMVITMCVPWGAGCADLGARRPPEKTPQAEAEQEVNGNPLASTIRAWLKYAEKVSAEAERAVEAAKGKATKD